MIPFQRSLNSPSVLAAAPKPQLVFACCANEGFQEILDVTLNFIKAVKKNIGRSKVLNKLLKQLLDISVFISISAYHSIE